MYEETADEELMARYRDGDTDAFETLYQRNKGPLYRYLLRQCGKTQASDELFQDIWMKIIQSRMRYRANAGFKTYLFTIAHNRVVDHYRRQGGLPPSYDAEDMDDLPAQVEDLPERFTYRQQQVDRLLRLIDALPAAQRETFLLREEAGMGVDEIARVTGVTRETAKSRLRYAMNRLRNGFRETP